jgi:cellulose synthase/poly-beta-1,6-N-acetylglucosamine synthase-like glycosyltransferase
MIISQVLFWTGVFLIFHTYILFPALLRALASGKTLTHPPLQPGQHPGLSILIAAFNEEQVIESKIRSVLGSDYPSDRLEILVGSDASTDRTNEIITGMQKDHPQLRVHLFGERTGKPGVINALAGMASCEILVITDANVMLADNTLSRLASAFSHERTGLVDTRMVNIRLQKDGISHQEKYYINREVRVKYHESLIWGSMMGPFGGCYAVRRECFRPVPGNFLVDDFFINMSVLQQDYLCISNPDAQVFEDVSNDLAEEFRRKERISAGNFQNLARFRTMLFRFRRGISFCFLSHKVIRWLVPFLVLVTLGTSVALGLTKAPELSGLFYLVMASLQVLVMLIPVMDYFLRKLKIHSIPLRFISHFVLMNLALLAGFFRYAGGIRTNVWQPTRRNQGDAEQR